MLYVNIPASNLECIGLTMCVFRRVFFSSENYTVNSTDPHIYQKKQKNKTKQSKTKEKKTKH